MADLVEELRCVIEDLIRQVREARAERDAATSALDSIAALFESDETLLDGVSQIRGFVELWRAGTPAAPRTEAAPPALTPPLTASEREALVHVRRKIAPNDTAMNAPDHSQCKTFAKLADRLRSGAATADSPVRGGEAAPLQEVAVSLPSPSTSGPFRCVQCEQLHCEVCDRAECGVSTAAARTASVTIPVTPGENGCDCYGVFARGHNPARGCPVHGAPTYSSDIEAAWSAEKDARADCRAHAIDWRKRALEAEAKLATPAEGGVLTVDACCPHPVERHAYNGCANCGCAVQWTEHPDRDRDMTQSAQDARRWADDVRARVKAARLLRALNDRCGPRDNRDDLTVGAALTMEQVLDGTSVIETAGRLPGFVTCIRVRDGHVERNERREAEAANPMWWGPGAINLMALCRLVEPAPPSTSNHEDWKTTGTEGDFGRRTYRRNPSSQGEGGE